MRALPRAPVRFRRIHLTFLPASRGEAAGQASARPTPFSRRFRDNGARGGDIRSAHGAVQPCDWGRQNHSEKYLAGKGGDQRVQATAEKPDEAGTVLREVGRQSQCYRPMASLILKISELGKHKGE